MRREFLPRIRVEYDSMEYYGPWSVHAYSVPHGFHMKETEYLSLEEANHMAELKERDTWRAAAELVPEEFRELLLKGVKDEPV